MDEPARPPGSLRDLAEEVLLAALGVVALTRDRAEAIVDDLVRRGRLARDDAPHVVDELMNTSRGDGRRLTERAGGALSGLFRDLGLVTEREVGELELRVAQLEHRLRLLERKAGGSQDAGASP